jgi:hydrogenase-4 membrane subunit HyfE
VGSVSTPTIERHPDLVALQTSYDRAAQGPTAQFLEGTGVLAGIFLAISPWVVGFTDLSAMTANNLITGTAMAVLAFGFTFAFGRTHGLIWTAPVLGIWTILAPWLVTGAMDTTETITTNVIVGAAYLLVGAVAMTFGPYRAHR